MKLNFGAAGSKHDKQQQNSMWEATLFTRISVKKKKQEKKEKEGRISRASSSEEMKTRQRRNCAAKIFCCALFFAFFPLVFCFWTTTTWKKREHLALSEKKEQKRTFTDFSCGAKGSGIKTSPRQTSRYIWFHTRLPYLFPNVFASR